MKKLVLVLAAVALSTTAFAANVEPRLENVLANCNQYRLLEILKNDMRVTSSWSNGHSDATCEHIQFTSNVDGVDQGFYQYSCEIDGQDSYFYLRIWTTDAPGSSVRNKKIFDLDNCK